MEYYEMKLNIESDLSSIQPYIEGSYRLLVDDLFAFTQRFYDMRNYSRNEYKKYFDINKDLTKKRDKSEEDFKLRSEARNEIKKLLSKYQLTKKDFYLYLEKKYKGVFLYTNQYQARHLYDEFFKAVLNDFSLGKMFTRLNTTKNPIYYIQATDMINRGLLDLNHNVKFNDSIINLSLYLKELDFLKPLLGHCCILSTTMKFPDSISILLLVEKDAYEKIYGTKEERVREYEKKQLKDSLLVEDSSQLLKLYNYSYANLFEVKE